MMELSYDSENDIVTIEGTRYSGDIFRNFGQSGLGVGRIVEIIEAKDGMIVLRNHVGLGKWLNDERESARHIDKP